MTSLRTLTFPLHTSSQTGMTEPSAVSVWSNNLESDQFRVNCGKHNTQSTPATERIQLRDDIIFESLFKDFQARGRNATIIYKLKSTKQFTHHRECNNYLSYSAKRTSPVSDNKAPHSHTR
jgi:hypothetical protein